MLKKNMRRHNNFVYRATKLLRNVLLYELDIKHSITKLKT